MTLFNNLFSGLTYLLLGTLLASCGSNSMHDPEPHNHDEHGHGHNHEPHNEQVSLSQAQFDALDLAVAPIGERNLNAYVEASGQLEVPPQNEATVTAIIGANVVSIEVIEGNEVEKGQVLAYISHPDLVSLQTDYLNSWSQLQYLEKDYQRQKKLYEENVGSAKSFESVQASYISSKGVCQGYEAKMALVGLDASKVRTGAISARIPVKSPIDGHIMGVDVKIGQYVQPQTELFEIVNIDHIHADLMVFEKDMHLIEVGQKVRFSVESIPEKELEATIYSMGKAFEQEPKAVHLHADIGTKEGLLIPGTFIRGRILISEDKSLALPEEAIVREGDQHFAFTAEKENDGQWSFKPVEIQVGQHSQGWTAVKHLAPQYHSKQFVQQGAYYLMAEMKKEEAEHSH